MTGRNNGLLIERLLSISRLVYGSAGTAPRLTRTQWIVLRYLSQANERSRTAAALSQYYGASPGSISETVDALARRGFLSRLRLPSDRRHVRLDLTEKARQYLREDPCGLLAGALSELSVDEEVALESLIGNLVARMSAELERPLFGPCRSCRFCGLAGEADSPGKGARCLRFGAPLEEDALDALCLHYEVA